MNAVSTIRTSAAHQSEIQFTCPTWCIRTRQDHLEDLANNEGLCLHSSSDRTGADSGGSHWYVAISAYTYPDGTPAGDDGILIEVDTAGNLVLSAQEARRMAAAVCQAADGIEPLHREAFTAIVEAMETTLEEVAVDAGVDLSTATQADSVRLTRTLGLRLTGRDDVSVGPGTPRNL